MPKAKKRHNTKQPKRQQHDTNDSDANQFQPLNMFFNSNRNGGYQAISINVSLVINKLNLSIR